MAAAEAEAGAGHSVLALPTSTITQSSAAQLVEAVLQDPRCLDCYVLMPASQEPASHGDGAASTISTPQGGAVVTAGDINAIACLLDRVALSERPQLRCTPLLPAAGWTLDRIAALPQPAELLVLEPPSGDTTSSTGVHMQMPMHSPGTESTSSTGGHGASSTATEASTSASASPSAAAAAAEVLRRRPSSLPPWAHARRRNPQPPQPSTAQPPNREGYVTDVDGAPAPPARALRFRRVAVGGTFDRLHAGHELLLAATALVSEGFVFVGITADALLANKSHRELLQPYDVRKDAALSYLQAVRPDLQVSAGPLSDPKEPTAAETDPDMEALVVSVETLAGATAINAGRKARGFRPLTVVTVPVIGLPRSGAGAGAGGSGAGGAGAVSGAGSGGAAALMAGKLSSSGLRAAEAEARARAHTAEQATGPVG
ncbi:hypothetical protein HYH03_008970 [Edaphochlamys debaryana]|uniref:Cytidyltransferase-like domain-containing protein n=1 Tax=Edaphochlamys debaryana TaxID=47281 RepID=A0A835XZE2_9CHLO|nr:hypothetical protein HYH03_008970 [Edaphochlamys debaryana]|eukprot:KAG2492810.1 hypothetical protein HYH03_008970 [Edaphochlamys debaryana]